MYVCSQSGISGSDFAAYQHDFEIKLVTKILINCDELT